MVNSMVDRATSDMLIGPDWAMNIEICDMLNHDPGQAKDVVKGIKKRLGSKNPKVQLLALTLLETVIKNCGDLVHMHVAEKDVLHEMVKIVKKKPDVHVKDKILILIDTWQEAFGGPRARYPQYYAAYQELLRIGAVFPQRSERAAPVFTPPQTQPLSSYPQNLRSPEFRQEEAEASTESEFPTLSLTEIQNARGIMDVLAEMLNAVDPGNKEGLRQEVIVDLVEQCRVYKQKVVHLVNSTSDESLLCQGLALNDDLQRLLARHESMVSGTPAPAPAPAPPPSVQVEKPKPEPVRNLLDINDPPSTTTRQPDGSSTSTASLGSQPRQPLLPTPPTNGTVTTPPAKLNPKMDLLSGDDYNSPTADNPLALVPVGPPPQPTSSAASQQNTLALVDMFSQNTNHPPNSFNAHPTVQAQQPYLSTPPQFQQQQQQQNFQPQQPAFYSNGMPQYEQQSLYAQGSNPWNAHNAQPQPPPSAVYGGQTGESLPLPPWEAQATDNSQVVGSQYPQQSQVTEPQPMGNSQMAGMYTQPMTGGGHMASPMYPQQMQGQYMGMVPQAMHPQQMYGNQMGGYGYGGPQQDPRSQFLDQRMYGLSVRDDSALTNSSYQVSTSSYSYGQPMKASKPEDKLFGDLVNMAKSNPKSAAPGRAGSM